MAGIAAHGIYVPKYRLGPETSGWNSPIERAIANFDEDSVTMAVAAGADCLRSMDRDSVDGLIFASTTPPYAEKQCAAIVATALDLKRDIFTADLTDVLRAGTSALRTACDAVKAGSARQVLAVAADSRQGPPRGETERTSGDGAVALLVSAEAGIAELVGFHSISENMLDTWRSAGDQFVRSWEDRFATEEGLERIVPAAVSEYLARQQIGTEAVGKIAYYTPDGRKHAQLARHMGFKPAQVQDPLFGRLGNTGAAFPLMLLVGALEEAAADQLVLTVSYGDGSDVLGFRTTASLRQPSSNSPGLSGYLEAKKSLASYETYARWREVWTSDDAARRPTPASPSVTALWRDSDRNLRLYGAKCDSCGYLQYPPQRVCVNCQTRDETTPVRLSDEKGSLFTYSMDYIAGAVDTPLVVSAVDFDCGGRMICMLTDREIDEVQIGMPVEMSFRKLRVVNGIHNYYWKAIPQRFSNEPQESQKGS
ncbi:MAG: OB-fold domain-containing protein [Dehalococcoidia bacterium]